MADDITARGRALAESAKYHPSSFTAIGIEPEEVSAEIVATEAAPIGEADHAVDGASFILDRPAGVPAIWGRGSHVLWARGEALMVAGPQGLGKTTLSGQLLRASLGLGDGQVLGYPVADLGCRVLYLAMDRPSQIARSMARQFGADDRRVLAERVKFWKGPPPRDLAANPTLLAKMASYYEAGVVFVDSLKDAAVRLTEDGVGAQYNRARQHALAQGIQVCELHHTIKRGPQGAPIASVADIYGSTWLTSGAGSVILLTGEPGDPVVGFRHVKQPAQEVGPFTLLHDHIHGMLSVEFGVDLVEMVRNAGIHGLTAKEAALVITEKQEPTRADIEKARRKLDQKVAGGVLVRVDGTRGGASDGQKGGTPAAWFLCDGSRS
ncbi:MAG TPA: AAA family ATPase [Mycobacterium sp.]|nr:AAA family ATPase [Mycobacterium sp.]